MFVNAYYGTANCIVHGMLPLADMNSTYKTVCYNVFYTKLLSYFHNVHFIMPQAK